MTPIELRRKVLEKLKVLAAGEPAYAGDANLVQSKYEWLHEELLQENLIGWSVSEDIPAEYSHIVVAMVAAECVNEFYCPPDLKAELIRDGKFSLKPQDGGPSVAEKRMRRLSAAGFDGEPAQSEYF